VTAAATAAALLVVRPLLTSEHARRLDISAPSDSTNVYRDSRFGFSLRYPEGWRVQPFATGMRVTYAGVLVTNIPHTFTHPSVPDGATSAWDFRGVPDHVVVVELQHRAGGPLTPPSSRPDTQFPLSLDSAITSPTEPQGVPRYGAPESLYVPVTVEGDSDYLLRVWFGSRASERDKQIAREIVASIAF
jgi:hypothetical protein